MTDGSFRPSASTPSAFKTSEEGALHASLDVQRPCPARSGRQGDDVFLMNTFTDAQLIVSRDVAALLDRLDPGVSALTAEETRGAGNAGRARLHRARPRIRAASHRAVLPRRPRRHRSAARHRAHDAAVQLRVRLLHPGRPRRLQQARREDVARHSRRVSPPGPRNGSTRSKPESFVLTLFGGEPLLNLPVVYYLAERLWRASQERGVRMHAQRHHQRAAAHARGGRSARPLRPQRRQDHARRRPRHAQPHAAAARRPGHVRQDHRERPARRRKLPNLDRRQLRRDLGRQLPGAARLSARAGVRGQARSRGLQADHPRAEAAAGQGPDPAHGRRHARASR